MGDLVRALRGGDAVARQAASEAWQRCVYGPCDQPRSHGARKAGLVFRRLDVLFGLVCAFIGLACLTTAFAGDVPDRTLAAKGRLVLADDFSTDRFGSLWKEMIPSAGVENGATSAGNAHHQAEKPMAASVKAD